MLWVLVFINVPQVLLSHYTVPYDQVSFSDLNIYPHPRTIKVQAGESIDLNARRLTSGDLKSADLSPDLLREIHHLNRSQALINSNRLRVGVIPSTLSLIKI